MKIHVRLFAALRDVVGRETLEMELAPGATPATVWEALATAHPELLPRRRSLAVAVNRSYEAFDTPLSAGDEVVFIPPIAGGAG